MNFRIPTAAMLVAFLFLGAACGGPGDSADAAASGAQAADGEKAMMANEEGAMSLEQLAEDLIINVGDRVFFETNKAELSDASKEILTAQAEWLNAPGHEELAVVVEGHCDERGTREYNLGLGARRATAVQDFLVEAGVDPYRVRTISHGKEKPVALCSREACWRLNRRSVVTLAAPGS